MGYYVVSDDKCFYEGMTKEQILSAITQAIESHEIHDVDTGFVTTLKEGNANKALTFWVGTSAQYNAIVEKNPNCVYILTDDTELEDLEAQIQRSMNVLKGEVIFDWVTNPIATSPIPFSGDSDSLGYPITSEHDIWDFTLVQVETKDNANSDLNVVCNVTPIIDPATQEKTGAWITGTSIENWLVFQASNPQIVQMNICLKINNGNVVYNKSTLFPINDPTSSLTPSGLMIKKIIGVI